jgi:hypothetical protein
VADSIVFAVARWNRKTNEVQWVRVTEPRTRTTGLQVGHAQLAITQVVGAFTAERPLPGRRHSQKTLIRSTLENLLGLPRAAIAVVEETHG